MFSRAQVTSLKCICGAWVTPKEYHLSWHLCRPCALRAKVRLDEVEQVWPQVMSTCKLTASHYGTTFTPRIVGVYCRDGLDVITVQVIPGQTRADFAKHAARLAEVFGVRRVAMRAGLAPGLVVLHLHHGDPLTATVPALPVPIVPDLAALPMGRRESGQTWTLRLAGAHVLVVGASNSGKGSFAQSLMRALAGGIASGTVRVWGFDPKGGMELANTEPLLDRFLCDKTAEMADAFDEAVSILDRRTVNLRGRTRQHVATVDDPTYILLIDELATLTAYADKALRERIKASLALVLTKGRAAGVHAVAMVQDGRKEVVPLRSLFTVRLGLHLAEASEVDLVLGDGARDRGALCDQIPVSMPGVGYVIDGDAIPERIRLSFPTDHDILALAAEYGHATTVRER